jgi:ribosomal protein S18 acetylase RimI-like enzyme
MIRDAEPADVDTILAFWRGAGADPSVTDDGASVLAAIAHPTTALLMAQRGRTLVGTSMVAWDGWRGTMYRVVVDPASRRSGVASEMVREAERRLRAAGCRRISILVLRDEAPAQSFWRATGFKLDERIARFVKPLDPHAR